MDDYMSTVFNKNFDEDGNIASKGYQYKEEIKKFLENNFLKKPPPKSWIERSFFRYIYKN